jgi:dolichyl-phosphate beta-glucosyltransferase
VTSLVFPTYNPGPLAVRTWRAVREFLTWAPGAWEVVFVCDGCTDGAPDRLAELTRPEARRVRVLSYQPNRGKGYAVRQGLLAARGQWRLFTDVDLAYGFEDVVRLARALQAGAAVAIGSRHHADSRLVVPPTLAGYAYRRHLQGRLFSLLTRGLLPVTQQDTQAGLKGMTAAVARAVLPHLACNGFGFDCELLTACARLGVPVAEVPVTVRYEDAASTTGLRTMLGMVSDLWRIRRRWRHKTVPGPRLAVMAEVAAGESPDGPHRPRGLSAPVLSRGAS